MIHGSNSIAVLEYKHVNIKLSMNLDRLTVETEVEQILKSKYNIKISNLLHNRDFFSSQNDGFVTSTVLKSEISETKC